MRKVINMVEYGACGDGMKNNQAVINAAIKELGEAGGTLFFPDGIYKTGTIFLESNITVFLDNNAEISGSTSTEDYKGEYKGCVEAPSFDYCLIYAYGKENIEIKGMGTINGNGAVFSGNRPMLMRFVSCKNIRLSDAAFKSSGSWCCHFVLCEYIYADKIKIENLVNGNNDGMDFDDCKNVYITKVSIKSQDDAICLKSSSGGRCENFVISDCILSSRTAAFKTGSASKGGFFNVTISNCVCVDCPTGVIKLIAVDGGTLKNFTISNIVMDRVGSPLFIRVGKRNLTFDAPKEMEYYTMGEENDGKEAEISDVIIRGIRANVTVKERDKTPVMITGLSSSPVKNIMLSDMFITFFGGGTKEEANNRVSEDPFRYPEQQFFGTLPSYAFFIRHATGMLFNDIRINSLNPDERKPCILEDVLDFSYNMCNFEVKKNV